MQSLWIQEVLNAYATNPKAQELLTRLAVHSPDSHGFMLDNGLIKYSGKVWISSNSALQTNLIATLHSSTIGGHFGGKATYHRLKQLFYWKGLRQDVESFSSNVPYVNRPNMS